MPIKVHIFAFTFLCLKRFLMKMKSYSTFPLLFLQQSSEFSQNQESESSFSLQMHSNMNETEKQNCLQTQLHHSGSMLPYLIPSANASCITNSLATTINQCNSSNAEKKRHCIQPFPSNMLKQSSKRPRDESHASKKKIIHQPVNAQVFKVPERKSQRLSDKITSLQKVVSPYGKTDTSSVLQEACMYINIAHQEIQRLQNSYFGARTLQPQVMHSTDLRTKGLCLAPVTVASPLVTEDLDDDSNANQGVLNSMNIWGF